MTLLGITVSGLDYAYPDEVIANKPLDPIVPPEEPEDTPAFNDAQQRLFEAAIAPALEANQRVDLTKHCTTS
jgi:hypothetical protein